MHKHGIAHQPYLDAVGASSKRSRMAVIVMVIASVLALDGFWNSRQGSWTSCRLRVARDAADWFVFADSDSSSSKISKGQNENDTLKIAAFVRDIKRRLKPELMSCYKLPPGVRFSLPLGIRKELASGKINTFSQDTIDRIDQAWRFVSTHEFTSAKRLDKFIEILEQARINTVITLPVPFFGVTFDVNDLGLLGGLTFIIILLMLRFCLAREWKNLKYVFEVARQRDALELYYDWLAMKQVFTVPRMRENSHVGMWEASVRALLFLPVIVQLCVFLHDLISFDIGFAISKPNTWIVCVASFVFLMVIVCLTYSCRKLWKGIDSEWQTQARTLKIIA